MYVLRSISWAASDNLDRCIVRTYDVQASTRKHDEVFAAPPLWDETKDAATPFRQHVTTCCRHRMVCDKMSLTTLLTCDMPCGK